MHVNLLEWHDNMYKSFFFSIQDLKIMTKNRYQSVHGNWLSFFFFTRYPIFGYPSRQDGPILPTGDCLLCSRKSEILSCYLLAMLISPLLTKLAR